jgi:hypothetical protein
MSFGTSRGGKCGERGETFYTLHPNMQDGLFVVNDFFSYLVRNDMAGLGKQPIYLRILQQHNGFGIFYLSGFYHVKRFDKWQLQDLNMLGFFF